MPYYEYLCETCGAETTVRLRVEQRDDFVHVPRCQHGEPGHPLTHPMKRKLSKTSFVLKGGGWAKDSYTKPS